MDAISLERFERNFACSFVPSYSRQAPNVRTKFVEVILDNLNISWFCH